MTKAAKSGYMDIDLGKYKILKSPNDDIPMCIWGNIMLIALVGRSAEVEIIPLASSAMRICLV